MNNGLVCYWCGEPPNDESPLQQHEEDDQIELFHAECLEEFIEETS